MEGDESAEVLEHRWHIEKEYKKCKNEIKVRGLALEDNMEKLLLPLVVHSVISFHDTIYDIRATVDGQKDEHGVSREAFQKGLGTGMDQVGLFPL